MQILTESNISFEQFFAALVAVPAFIPATVCTGYLAAWLTNLQGFRGRSVAERIFWSIPLSFAVSTILSVLIGRFISFAAITAFYILVAASSLLTVAGESFALRRARKHWVVGWKPLGGFGLLLAILWTLVAIVSLIDFQRGSNLYSTLFLWDHASRVNWTESILRTGFPPANSLYFYQRPAPMRNYYFWYVLCAAIAKLFHLPARAVVTASCAWGGFALAAIIGLYLKHVLGVGARLRKQFLLAISLLAVTGLDICVNFFEIFVMHRPLPLDLEWWSRDEIFSWYGSMLWVPHHVTALVCCMFALLLAVLSKSDGDHNRLVEIAYIGAALASAFGMSIFVPFGFFLLMIVWAIWQIAVEKRPRPVLQMAAGGFLALILLVPYLSELMHNSSTNQSGAIVSIAAGEIMHKSSDHQNGAIFRLGIREMIPAGALLRNPPLQSFALSHPHIAGSMAKLILLAPGYAIELGFFFVVLVVYLVPSLRPNRCLTPAERLLIVLTVAALPFITFIRSTVLASNDFGWRAALLVQFPLLLLASDLLMRWRSVDPLSASPVGTATRNLARIALFVGVISTISQALLLRFDYPLLEWGYRARRDPRAGIVSHNAYISYIGYAELDRVAPANAIVQFNPDDGWSVWKSFDFVNVNHQIAISSNGLWCGATLGGDPSGCPGMLAAIDPLFKKGSADQARSACRQYNINYLIAKIYDPPWHDPQSWVWTLPAAVSNPEFRVVQCR